FPARFLLVAAMNPCPCGNLESPLRECACTPLQIRAYRSRVSGPLLDRIDLQVEVPPVEFSDMIGRPDGEPSSAIRARVLAARRIQARRFRGEGIRTNAEMGGGHLDRHAGLDDCCRALLERAVRRLGLSARGIDRVRKVARTIADLRGGNGITPADLAEAIQYRSLERGT
ncbi:MAG: ATP-binding protein, partial [Acidobacteria bacterium]|nr:ATP-binding protein [Acidobacteriota bacterium]